MGPAQIDGTARLTTTAGCIASNQGLARYTFRSPDPCGDNANRDVVAAKILRRWLPPRTGGLWQTFASTTSGTDNGLTLVHYYCVLPVDLHTPGILADADLAFAA